MKKLLLISILLFALPLISQNFEFYHIGSITIDPFELGQTYDFAATEFILSNKSTIGKHYSFNLSDIIDPYLKDLSIEKRSNVIIIAEDMNGETQPFSYTDVSADYSMIPALLTFTKKIVSFPDTLIVGEDISNVHGLEIDKVEEFFNVLTKRRIFLQLKSISDDEKNRLFKTTSVIFPVDKTPNRWLTDLKAFHIYLYEGSK
jgi:hypothetical protein